MHRSTTVHRHSPTRIPALALAAVLCLLLAACGGNGTGSGESSSTTASDGTAPSDASGSEGSEATAFPVSIEHKFGTTEIPTRPEQVVTVGFTDVDFVLALGVTPVGIRDWYGDQPNGVWPWAQDELGDAEPTLLSAGELEYERIAALEPDLITAVSAGLTQEQYDLLSEIAPTVPQTGEYVDYGMPWQEQMTLIARALGQTAEAEQIVADVEEQLATVREEHPEFRDATAAVAFLNEGQPGAYASQDSRSRLMESMGFTIPPRFDELAGDAFFFTVSQEQITVLDTDVVVWIASTDELLDEIRALPLREALTASAEGREVFVGKLIGGAFSYASPLSIPFLLDELVPQLAAAVDGDPATAVPTPSATADAS